MFEWGLSFREIEEWTDRQFEMFLTRLEERKQRESKPNRRGAASLGASSRPGATRHEVVENHYAWFMDKSKE